MNDIDEYCVAMMLYSQSTSHSISRIASWVREAPNVWITISKWSLSRSRPDSAISLASRYVQVDYHVQVQGHYYSVPYKYLKKQLNVRETAMTVEMFLKNRRVASHVRSRKKYGYTTLIGHMPDSHEQAGGQTAHVITKIIESRQVPQLGFKSCLGIMNLGKSYGMDRLEAACNRA